MEPNFFDAMGVGAISKYDVQHIQMHAIVAMGVM